MKALIIDDSKTMRRLLKSYIQSNETEIREARHGQDALETLEREKDFDLALVDWDMPVMNGLEFLKTVRANHSYDDLKVMMVTLHNSIDDIHTAINEGSNDFLMKPFTEDMMADKLRILGFHN